MRSVRGKQTMGKAKKSSEKDEINYAAAADYHAEREDDDAEAGISSDEENNNDAGESDNSQVTDDNKSDLDENDEEEASDDEAMNDEDEEEASDDEVDDDASDYEDDDDNKNTNQASTLSTPLVVSSDIGEPCTFDLRNLVAMNTHQLSSEQLYTSKESSHTDEAGTVTIPFDGQHRPNEEYLLSKAIDGCSQLIRALWQLPVERSDAGPLVILPSHDESRIPRALPPPAPKKETKWEKFAREKGLPLNKEKRSQKVWDEATGTWMFRHGYRKANDTNKEWPIMEVKDSEDPYDDPWERSREAKHTRVEKNREQRMKNEERAGNLAKGSTNRYLKNAESRRNAGKAGGIIDKHDIPPSGVPVDIGNRASKRLATSTTSTLKRGKEGTLKALVATQRSTASLGKFDKLREDEPERKKADSRALKKRKVPGGPTDSSVISSEKERSLKLLKVVTEGGVKKEKDRKSGRLATGETAYDYDYNDGLGPSSFRKKKGRAGAGKLKKMTKKRAK